MVNVLIFLADNYKILLALAVAFFFFAICFYSLEKKIAHLQKQVDAYDRYFKSVGLAHAINLVSKEENNKNYPKYAPGGYEDKL